MRIGSEVQLRSSMVEKAVSCVRQIAHLSRSNMKSEPFHSIRHKVILDSKGNVSRGVIALSTRGCSYARRFGACSICGHPLSCIWNDNITEEEMLGLFENSLARIRGYNPRTV